MLGHFAVRYLRVNPLGPVVEGNQVVVTSQEHELRYRRSGPVAGTYFVSAAETRDFGDGAGERDAVGDRRRDRARLHARLSRLPPVRLRRRASGCATWPLRSRIVAASSATYSDLVRLLDQHEARAGGHGERLCVRIAGTALSPDSAVSLDSGRDDPARGASA